MNFIGIGAQKAGTSWLASCLSEHPEICMHPKKEAHYFNKRTFYFNRWHYQYSFKNNNKKLLEKSLLDICLMIKLLKEFFNIINI